MHLEYASSGLVSCRQLSIFSFLSILVACEKAKKLYPFHVHVRPLSLECTVKSVT